MVHSHSHSESRTGNTSLRRKRDVSRINSLESDLSLLLNIMCNHLYFRPKIVSIFFFPQN